MGLPINNNTPEYREQDPCLTAHAEWIKKSEEKLDKRVSINLEDYRKLRDKCESIRNQYRLLDKPPSPQLTLNKMDLKKLRKKLAHWIDQKILSLTSLAKQDRDASLLKILEVAKNLPAYFSKMQGDHPQPLLNHTSCSFTSWAIADSIDSNYRIDFALENIVYFAGFNTNRLRKFLGRNSENFYFCEMIGKLKEEYEKIDIGHSFVIHEKFIGRSYKYRIYFSYVEQFDLKEYLATAGFDTPAKGWMDRKVLEEFLSKIDSFVSDEPWNEQTILDYQACFEVDLNGDGKKYFPTKGYLPFRFHIVKPSGLPFQTKHRLVILGSCCAAAIALGIFGLMQDLNQVSMRTFNFSRCNFFNAVRGISGT